VKKYENMKKYKKEVGYQFGSWQQSLNCALRVAKVGMKDGF
jgi:hypothetical protein